MFRKVLPALVSALALPLAAETNWETARLQGEIDAASAKGGGRVVVTKGVHPCGTLRLKKGVELHLEEGAVLLGGGTSADYDDVETREGLYPEGSKKVFIAAEDADDVAITGRGVIDGQGTRFFDHDTVLWGRYWAKPPWPRPRMIQFARCNRVRLEGVTFRDSPCWTMWLRHCSDVAVSGIRIEAEQKMINSDGIDFDGCRRVRVGNSYFRTGDDCVILRAMRGNDPDESVTADDTVVSNCYFNSTCQGVRIGCPSDDLIRNALFKDVVFEGNNAVVSQNPYRYLRPRRPGETGEKGCLRIENVVFENWKVKCWGHPVEIYAEGGLELGRLGGMTFRNWQVEAKLPFTVRGTAETAVDGVRFENVRGTVAAAQPFDVTGVKDLKLDGFEVRSGGGEPTPFKSPEGTSWETGAGNPRPGALDAVALKRLAETEYRHAVRPIGVDGQEAWNVRSDWFIYPPTFGFRTVGGAAEYRFDVYSEVDGLHVFTDRSPNAALTPVWQYLPVGWVHVVCTARDAKGAYLGTAGVRDFWRAAPYRPGTYPEPAMKPAEAMEKIVDDVLNREIVKLYFLSDDEVPSNRVNASNQIFISYPAKMGSSVMQAAARMLKDPSRHDYALRIAAGAKKRMFSITEPDGAALAGWPVTYRDHPGLSGYVRGVVAKKGDRIMTIYPAQVANGYLALYEGTKDAELLAAAVKIADRYLGLQGADGTWALNFLRADGRPAEENRLVPVGVATFLSRLARVTGEAKYRAAAERAFAYVEAGPLKTWNWEGQFEDVPPTKKFQNLTKHGACDAAIYLANAYPKDARRLAQARELVRFAEDQFVCWERPLGGGRGDDPRLPNRLGGWERVDVWRCPAALEQYNCYVPIDASAAKMVRAYVALYRAGGSALDLAKAKTLADAIVRETKPDGLLPTFWGNSEENWPNCALAAASALGEYLDAAGPR